MLRAPRLGHDVLFVETGDFVGRHAWRLLRQAGRRSLAMRLAAEEQVAPGVRVVKALNLLPWGSKFRLPNAVNCAVSARLLRRRASRAPQPVILWIYAPAAARMAGSAGETFAVYDCVDDYSEQTTSPRRRRFVAACDREAASRSRLVFTTSKAMYRRQQAVNVRTHYVPNVGDYEHFRPAAERSFAAPEVSDLPRPVLGFAGNFLTSKVDLGLLEAVATARPEWTLLLVGPPSPDAQDALDRLTRLPNVRWLGLKPYGELPRYVAAFDVGLIPYVSNAYTQSCFPLKLYEYLAAGKPVVATGLPELEAMEPDVTLVDGTRAFIQAVEAALRLRGPDDCRRRIELASRNSWDARVGRLLELIDGELSAGPRISP